MAALLLTNTQEIQAMGEEREESIPRVEISIFDLNVPLLKVRYLSVDNLLISKVVLVNVMQIPAS